MAKIGVALIGCGKLGLSTHLPNCVAARDVELRYCCDINEQSLKKAESFNPQETTSDYRDVLNDPQVDMVITSVPHGSHMFFLKEVICAGKHVFCEKPMTMTMDQAYEVIKLVRQKGVKLCVDYNRRLSPAMIDLKQAYQSHRTNPSGQARVYTQEQNKQAWPEEKGTMLLIRINDESLTYAGMALDWKEGGGQIIGEGCHWLDLACWLLEDRPTRITAVGSTRLNYIVNLEFAQAAMACIMFSACGTFEYPKELIEIQNQGKIFRSECFVENQYFGRGDRTTTTFPLRVDHYPQAGTQGGLAGYLEKIDAMGTEYLSTGKFDYVFPDKGHFGLLDAFAQAIAQNEPSPIDAVDGMRATYLSLRAMDSIRLGTPLPINIEDWDMYVH